jgi:hypothetical protein
MNWFRTHIRLGSRLALFALAVQCVLSFGHVHVLAPPAAKAAPAVTAGASDLAVPSKPAGIPKSDGSTGADCAICASIQLSAISPPAVAPTLPLPANVGPSGLHTSLSFDLTASPYVLFQVRAPPSI